MIPFNLSIKKKGSGHVQEFNSWMEISAALWEGTDPCGGYRTGDVIYAHSRIDSLFGLMGVSLLLNDLERCGFRPILRLLKAESAFVRLADNVGLLYRDLEGPVFAPPDAISDGWSDTEDLRGEWLRGEV